MSSMWMALAATIVGVSTFAGTRIYYANRIYRLSKLLGEANEKVVSRENEIRRLIKSLNRATRPSIGPRYLRSVFRLQDDS